MDAAVNIFLNGIGGVFLGMTVLYLAIKLIGLVARGRSQAEGKE